MTDSVLRPDPQQFIKLSEYAAHLGICTRTARRWIAAGQIEGVQTKGGHWRIPFSELDRRDISLTQFAHLVGVHPVTVRRWCHADQIKHSTSPTGYFRIPISEVPRLGRARRTR